MTDASGNTLAKLMAYGPDDAICHFAEREEFYGRPLPKGLDAHLTNGPNTLARRVAGHKGVDY